MYTVDGTDSIDISALLKRMSELSIVIKDLQTQQSSLEDIFVKLVSERRMSLTAARIRVQPPRRLGDLQVRDRPRAAHAGAEPGDAGHHHVAVLRGVRRRDRLAPVDAERRQLRRLHRARTDHAGAVHREPVQRLLRNLFPEIHRHDLRTAVRAGVLRRNRHRLRRRGGDQVGGAWV